MPIVPALNTAGNTLVVGHAYPLACRPRRLVTASGIYVIRNTESGFVYVGSSKDLARRWKAHRGKLRAGQHPCLSLQRQYDQYGEDCFTIKVVEFSEPQNLADRERAWLHGAYRADRDKVMNTDLRLITENILSNTIVAKEAVHGSA